MQIVHEMNKLRLTAEYRKQNVEAKKNQFESPTNQEGDTAAVRADYQANDKLGLSFEQQLTLKGDQNNQTTVFQKECLSGDRVLFLIRPIAGPFLFACLV